MSFFDKEKKRNIITILFTIHKNNLYLDGKDYKLQHTIGDIDEDDTHFDDIVSMRLYEADDMDLLTCLIEWMNTMYEEFGL